MARIYIEFENLELSENPTPPPSGYWSIFAKDDGHYVQDSDDNVSKILVNDCEPTDTDKEFYTGPIEVLAGYIIGQYGDVLEAWKGRLLVSKHWIWDDDSKPLDSETYVTAEYALETGVGFFGKYKAVSDAPGNAAAINGFIDALTPRYGLYARAKDTPDLQVQLEGHVTIGINNNAFNIINQNSPSFVPPVSGSETHLLYLLNTSGVISFNIATSGFTPGDPNTYYEIEPYMCPICEVSLDNTTTEITQDLIKDVRPIF